MKIYVVRNGAGLFFRPAGMGSCRERWVTMDRAKFYPKVGPAKSQVTWWSQNVIEQGPYVLLEFDLQPENAAVIDLTAHVSSQQSAKEKREAKRALRDLAAKKQRLEQEISIAQATLKSLSS